jgi:hypothetical protein
MKFAIATKPTPLLNTPDFHSVFKFPLPLDDQGLLKPIETVLLPGTPLTLLRQCSHQIFQVATPAYPARSLYADRRFLSLQSSFSPLGKLSSPSASVILERMVRLVGTRYIWGGNWHQGIPDLLDYYPPSASLDPISQATWTLTGVDCSGLLYEATEGFTPRNTVQLVHFGVPAQGFAPLDLIVWPGHVIVMLDSENCIESSCLKGGVVVTPLQQRLHEIKAHPYVVRRWI